MGNDIQQCLMDIQETVGNEAMEAVSGTVKNYEGEAAGRIARSLAAATYRLEDKDAVIRIAQTVAKYEGETAGRGIKEDAA